ncbi:MAG: hypothetical protein ACLQJF_21825 [Candidatus Sulfotelmatobacter sp.]|jgi:hypothetical protein
MVHITLYLPNNPMPEEFDVKTYAFREGRLYFSVAEGADTVNVTTTVPFLLREQEPKKR